MLASSGNWCSTDSQKAWMVWIFSPPGVSSASANSFRASAQLLGARAAVLRVPSILAASSASSEHRPFRQAGEDAVRHVGGGGARIGQAQDLRRVGAFEQQPDDALRQHMRLARAGIGRHPGRVRGIGGARLPVVPFRPGRDSAFFIRRRPRPARRRRPTIRARARDGRSRRRSRPRGTAAPARGSRSSGRR